MTQLGYLWLWLVEAWRGPFARARAVSFVVSVVGGFVNFAIPTAIPNFPETVRLLTWLVPSTLFGLLFAHGLLTAPYRLHLALAAERDTARAQLIAIEQQRPVLRVVFKAGEPPFEYISRRDVGNPFGEWEDWRRYSIGIENPGRATVHDVQVLLVSIARAGGLEPDRIPAELQRLDGNWGAFSVNPGLDGVQYVEMVRRRSTPPDHAPEPFEIDIAYANPDPTVGKPSRIPPGEYVFTIGVHGRDLASVEGPKTFRVTTERPHTPLIIEPLSET